MKFPLYIAKRYLFSGSSNNAINIITGISSLGIIAGTTAMFVVLSVFSGLKEFSLSFTNDFDPQLKAFSTKGKTFTVSPSQEKQMKAIKDIVSYTKVIEERALFSFNSKDHLAYIKGVDSNFISVNAVEKSIYQGQWLEPQTNQVVVGAGIAQKLSVGLFDLVNPFEAFVAKPGKGTIDNPNEAFNKMQLVPVGFYFLNEEISQKFVFCDLEVAQELLEFKTNQVSGIEFKLAANASESATIEVLEKIFKGQITLKNRTQLNASLYRMLNTENLILYLILTLVLIVTLFTLIGAIIMTIIDKKNHLKTLYSLGAEIKEIRRVFLLQGFLICLIGGIIGLVLGIVIVLLQKEYELVMITQKLAYPILFTFKNIIIVLLTIGILGFLASWIASSRVNRNLMDN
ncbi:ABC transporter permease [Flavobacterium sp.]|uniref:ABC transporter permease n=1 Tax=Flavobacterium sp. TaxID=239 RepID=UPI0037BE2F28